MSRPTKVPVEAVHEVLRAYQAGESLQELGVRYGCSSRTVARLLKINGVKIRQPVRSRIPPERVSELVSLFQAGSTPTELAAKYACSDKTVIKVLRAQGLSLQRPPKVPQEDRAQLVVDYQEGASLSELAARYDCSQRTMKLALAVELRPQGAQVKYKDPAFILQLIGLREAGQSYEDIAKTLGISTAVVGRVLKDRGLGDPFKAAGERHGHWKGGKAEAEGYVLTHMPADHPFASTMRRSNGYCLEHRLVMAESLDRPLKAHETVHHIDGDKKNNQIENLQLRKGKHGKHTRYRCVDCGSENVAAVPL